MTKRAPASTTVEWPWSRPRRHAVRRGSSSSASDPERIRNGAIREKAWSEVISSSPAPAAPPATATRLQRQSQLPRPRSSGWDANAEPGQQATRATLLAMLAGSAGSPTASRTGYDTDEVIPPAVPTTPAATPAAISAVVSSAESIPTAGRRTTYSARSPRMRCANDRDDAPLLIGVEAADLEQRAAHRHLEPPGLLRAGERRAERGLRPLDRDRVLGAHRREHAVAAVPAGRRERRGDLHLPDRPRLVLQVADEAELDVPGLDLGDREHVMADRDPPARHRLRQARLAVVDAVADGRLGDEAADPVLGAHDPGAGELLERPPDGEPVDAVALGEPRLGLQPLARRQLRPVDAGDEVLRDLPVERDPRLFADSSRYL